jgi:TRAP transporter 4TM/12TM fusion protein
MHRHWLATWIATLAVIYHLAAVGQVFTLLGVFLPPQIHSAISLTFACLVVFLFVPIKGHLHRRESPRLSWYDVPFLAALLAGNGYVVFFFDAVEDYSLFGFLDPFGVVLALALCVALLEAVRRATGIILPILILAMVAMTAFQAYLPGLLFGVGYDLDRILYSAYVGEGGIFGLPLKVASTIIFVFVVFGAVMEASGAGRWVIDLALSIAGRSRGGPAKASVVASAIFGSISGSPTSNAATTGAFTIPMMKSVGYSPAFSGAVEVVASTGGQILPPVMGAIAFVMAEWIGRSYAEVALAATLPAIVYFIIVFASVHLRARREGLQPIPVEKIQNFWSVLVRGWRHVIPFSALIYFLFVATYPPGLAGIYAIVAAIFSSYLSRNRSEWITFQKFRELSHDAVMRWFTITVITGAVGLMVGALELSGLGIKLTRFLIDLSGGDLLFALLLVGVACLVIGMGLDAIPAYVTLATLMAPALVGIGVPILAAHLFIVYWGLASFFTPPVCIAVYVVIAFSGAKVWETGWEALKLGIASFLVPFAFVFNDGLLFEGDPLHIAQAFVTAAIGAVLLACGIQGFATVPLSPIVRVLAAAAGFLFIAPGWLLPGAGAVLAIATLALGRLLAPQNAGSTEK